MFHRERVIAALEAKADCFTGYEAAVSDALGDYEQALAALAGLSRAEIEARLAGVDWPGARPTVEHDRHPDVVIPFDQTWANHEQARAWAREVLEGVPTVAVDGVDHADAHARIEFLRQLADGPSTALRTGLGCGFQEHLQEWAVGERERPQEIIGSEGDVNVASVAGAGIAAEHHAFDGLADVGLLIKRDLGVEVQIAPGIPVIAKDVPEAIVSGGVSGVAPGG